MKMKETIEKFLHNMRCQYYREHAYYSQYGQDYIALKILKNQNGFFVDIGANDGITFSNTYKMEQLGWQGICVEPDGDVYEKLITNRKCNCIKAAVSEANGTAIFTKITGPSQMLSGLSSEYEPEHIERIKQETLIYNNQVEEVEVQTRTFDDIMLEFGRDDEIDFLSIDTEGNEFKILQTIDFDKWKIKVIAVENNYLDNKVRDILKEKGYNLHVTCEDDIYIKA